MPVQIVDNNGGATSVEDGTIQIGDLGTMTEEYKNHVALTAIPPTQVIIKRTSFYFTKAQVLALFNHYEGNVDANAVEIAIGVQVPDTMTQCDQESPVIDNSHCLAVIVSMTNKTTRVPINNIDDYILINGYKSSHAWIDVEPCCPGSKPPPPR